MRLQSSGETEIAIEHFSAIKEDVVRDFQDYEKEIAIELVNL